MNNTNVLHYKILEKLGEGGMGVVYKAKDLKLNRNVAIKFLPRFISADEEERKRFENEAQAAAALNHSNIATIYAIEESKDQIFIVMEYIDGIELKDKIKTGAIPIEETINLAIQIAEGLEAAHKKGVVHRDIKSSNIMITNDGKVKIMDFGLAKIKGGAQLTKIGSTVGTVAYMSPEQAQGEEVDHRTDIWSFGIVLYEMITGKLPFKGEYDQAIIYLILNEEPISPDKLNPDIPAGLSEIIGACLQKDYKSRNQSLKEISENLNKAKDISVVKVDEPQLKKIAILPFINVGGNTQSDYLGFALADQVIGSLAYLKEVLVRPSASIRKCNGKHERNGE
jgi:serine/threonine protein kinase